VAHRCVWRDSQRVGEDRGWCLADEFAPGGQPACPGGDKRKAFGLQMATVTLSATITVLLGLRTSATTRTLLLNIALGLGALITVLAAAEAFFTHRRLWVLRTATVRRLEALSRHVDFHGANGRPPDAGALTACLTELDAIIADDQKAWQHLHESPPAAHESRLVGTTELLQPETPPHAAGADQ
jgi:hypothetical protein